MISISNVACKSKTCKVFPDTSCMYLQTAESQCSPAGRRRCLSSPGCLPASCSVYAAPSCGRPGVRRGSRSATWVIYLTSATFSEDPHQPVLTAATIPSQTRSGTVGPRAPEPVSLSQPCGSPCHPTSCGAVHNTRKYLICDFNGEIHSNLDIYRSNLMGYPFSTMLINIGSS